MDNWMILAIPQTSDRDAIKQAYMSQLPLFNPEDDPEGFTRLRTAYEEILQDLDADKPREDTPYSLFITQVEAVYQDFHKRNDISQWQALLDSEVCQRLDMVDETEQQLLTFLLGDYFLPRHVWNALSAHFDWPGREEYLMQNFPPQFIDYIIKKANEPEHPRYDLFTLGNRRKPKLRIRRFSETRPKLRVSCDAARLRRVFLRLTKATQQPPQYDRWISLFLDMESIINSGQHESQEFAKKQAQLEAIPLSHPYYAVLQTRLAMHRGEHETALTLIESAHKAHPGDLHIWFAHTAVLPYVGREDEALAKFMEMLKENPGLTDAKKGILNIQLKQKDYEAANLTAKEIFEDSPYDLYVLTAIKIIAKELCEVYEEKHASSPEDEKVALKLAGFYLKNQQL